MRVFMYNIEGGKAVKIKMLCRKLNIESREIKKDEFGVKLSALLGLQDDLSAKPDSDFSDEMLYFADFYGSMLSIFLNQLRRIKAPVALKAVMTEANLGFTSRELYEELKQEHEMLNPRRKEND